MKKRILSVGIIALLMLISLFSGYYVGQQNVDEPEVRIITQKPAERIMKEATSVAAVNLDAGIIRDGVAHNYGAELLKKADDSVIHTALEVARTDVENGDVGAYIIIPANFSELVNSINSTVEHAVIEYGISQNIMPEAREEVVKKINDICREMNNDLSHVYISAILNSVYTVQNDAETIMGNDQRDLEVLQGIQSTTIIQFVELPELKMAENTITDLDLTDQYNANHSVVTNLGNSYNGFIAAGQTEVDSAKAQSTIVNNTVGTMNSDLGSVQADITNFSNLVSAAQSTIVDYTAWTTNVDTAITQYDVMIDGVVNQANVDIVTLHSAAVQLQTLLGGSSTYTILDPNMRNTFKTTVANNLIALGVSVPPGAASWDAYLDSQWSAIEVNYTSSGSMPSFQANVNDYTIQAPYKLADSQTPITQSQNVTVKDYIINEQITNGIIDQANTSRTTVINNMDMARTTLTNSMTNLSATTSAMNAENNNLSNSLGNIDLGNHVDAGQVSGLLSQLDSNQSAVEAVVTGKMGEYQQFAMQSAMDAQENVMSMQESILKANDQTSVNLEEQLTIAKRSREATNNENAGSLYNITQQLSYTRNGTITNDSLLRYMAEPLLLQNQAVADVLMPDMTEEEITTNETTVQVNAYIPVVLGILSVLVLFAVILQKTFEKINLRD